MANIVPVLHFASHDVIITILFFLCVCTLAWVKISNPKRIPALFTGFIKSGSTEENSITPDSVALFFVFLCSVVILCMQGLQLKFPQLQAGTGEELLFFTGVLVAWYFLKTIVISACGFIFDIPKYAGEYINEIYIFAHFTGIVLLPVAIFVTYSDLINKTVLLWGILVLIGLLISFRTIKMFILMTNRGLNIVYLFLYLCSLEIIPLILIYKFCRGINF